MNRSKIEWTDFTINPVEGLCPVDCKDNQGKSYCYARKLYKRFKWNPEIRYDGKQWEKLCGAPSSKVFVGSTIELFGDWVKPLWLETIFRNCQVFSHHTFIFLTKQPENLLRWSPFPRNYFVGVSVTNQEMHNRAIACLAGIKALIKFISYEPLLGEIIIKGAYDLSEIQWVIIGQITPAKKATMPKIEWVEEIVRAAEKTGIPVFLKNNLKSILPIANPFYKQYGVPMYEIILRQEFPNG